MTDLEWYKNVNEVCDTNNFRVISSFYDSSPTAFFDVYFFKITPNEEWYSFSDGDVSVRYRTVENTVFVELYCDEETFGPYGFSSIWIRSMNDYNANTGPDSQLYFTTGKYHKYSKEITQKEKIIGINVDIYDFISNDNTC